MLRWSLCLLLAACATTPTDTDSGAPDTGDTADTADTSDTATDWAAWCEAEGFGASTPWNATGPYGSLRHDTAADFAITQTDGTTWRLSENWSGCETYVFVRDDIVRTVSKLDSIWSKDVDDLIAGSPRNTHYFFISTYADEATATANRDALLGQIDKALADLSAEDAAWWKARLHVADGAIKTLADDWLKDLLRDRISTYGIAIDRYQTLRGVGSFADVTRSDNSNEGWPFQNNLAFAAHEARYLDQEGRRLAALAAEVDPTIVQLWDGQVISEYADMTVELPSAAEMAEFDTLEIDIDMRCPDPETTEQGNCGAWDYIANFYVQDADGTWIEMSRFITTYHREARWIADATPMIPFLLDGGAKTFRWSWAPSWNVQPTETRIQLRLTNQGKPYKPRATTLVATGGGFNSTYNDGRETVTVPVSTAAKKVQLWANLTGHGMESGNCAEFCNHQHEFTVDGETYFQEYTMASTETGCIQQIENQMTPNQSGTWWYGRGGWCPGQIVMPIDVDFTDAVGTDGEAQVSYRGLFDDVAPPPEGSYGSIVLNAWLVVYE